MKKYDKADKVLAVVFLLFLLLLVTHKYFPGNFVIKLLFAAAEAALIGGIADWFAVTALFKKPLGFPWHTALIPRHREKLTAAIVDMVQGKLLNSDSIKAQLRDTRLVDYMTCYLEKGSQPVSLRLIKAIERFFTKFSCEDIAKRLAEVIKKFACGVDLKPVIMKITKWLYENKVVDKGIDNLIDKLILLTKEPAFLEYLTKFIEELSQGTNSKKPESLWDIVKGAAKEFLLGAAKAADIFNPRDAAVSLKLELISLLTEAKQQHSPLRKVLDRCLHDVIRQLEDNKVQENIAVWQREVTKDLDLEEILTHLLKSIQNAAKDNRNSFLLAEWLTVRLEKYWHAFKSSKAMQDWLEEYLQRALLRLVSAQEDLIGEIIVQALSSLSDEELNDFVNDKAGQDLAWIRINGSVVGAIVGTGIFLLVQEVYYPFIVSIFRGNL